MAKNKLLEAIDGLLRSGAKAVNPIPGWLRKVELASLMERVEKRNRDCIMWQTNRTSHKGVTAWFDGLALFMTYGEGPCQVFLDSIIPGIPVATFRSHQEARSVAEDIFKLLLQHGRNSRPRACPKGRVGRKRSSEAA